MSDIGGDKQPVGTGVMLYRGDGGSPEQFHLVGELIEFGAPGLKGRVEELRRKIQEGKKPIGGDLWALAGDPVDEQVARGAQNAKRILAWRRSVEKTGSREQHAHANRMVVEALQTLQVLAAPPPKELIELIAHQLQVVGKPRNSIKDSKHWWTAVRLIAENPGIADRAAARLVGKNHKTIRAWREKEEFQKAVHSEQETNRNLRVWEEMNAQQVRRRAKEVGDNQ